MCGYSGLIWTVEAGHTALKWHAYREVSQLGHDSAARSVVVWESVADRRLVWEDLKTFDPLERVARVASLLEPALLETKTLHGAVLRGGIALTAHQFLKSDELRELFNRLSIVPLHGWQVISVQTVLRHLASFNVVFSYDEPQTLGLDRLLNALAVVQTSDVPTFVISAGTAITLDVLIPTSEGDGWQHQAGAILPGVTRLSQALSDILSSPMHLQNSRYPASNTSESLSNGLLWLLKGALSQGLSHIHKVIPSSSRQVQIILCGGDTLALQPLLKDLLSDLSRQQTYKQSFSFICAQDWTSRGVLWAMMQD